MLVRDESIYSRYILAVTNVAIDFLETERDWRAIRARSASLSPQERSRLERILAFMEDELKDEQEFVRVQRTTTQDSVAMLKGARRRLKRGSTVMG